MTLAVVTSGPEPCPDDPAWGLVGDRAETRCPTSQPVAGDLPAIVAPTVTDVSRHDGTAMRRCDLGSQRTSLTGFGGWR